MFSKESYNNINSHIDSILYSKELGVNNIVNKEEPDDINRYSGQIKLTENSKRNNIEELNRLTS